MTVFDVYCVSGMCILYILCQFYYADWFLCFSSCLITVPGFI